jgi:hypothetical protein
MTPYGVDVVYDPVEQRLKRVTYTVEPRYKDTRYKDNRAFKDMVPGPHLYFVYKAYSS